MVGPDHSSPSNYLSSVTTYFIKSLLRGHLSECLLDFSLNLQSFLQLFTETLKLVKGSLIQAGRPDSQLKTDLMPGGHWPG